MTAARAIFLSRSIPHNLQSDEDSIKQNLAATLNSYDGYRGFMDEDVEITYAVVEGGRSLGSDFPDADILIHLVVECHQECSGGYRMHLVESVRQLFKKLLPGFSGNIMVNVIIQA